MINGKYLYITHEVHEIPDALSFLVPDHGEGLYAQMLARAHKPLHQRGLLCAIGDPQLCKAFMLAHDGRIPVGPRPIHVFDPEVGETGERVYEVGECGEAFEGDKGKVKRLQRGEALRHKLVHLQVDGAVVQKRKRAHGVEFFEDGEGGGPVWPPHAVNGEGTHVAGEDRVGVDLVQRSEVAFPVDPQHAMDVILAPGTPLTRNEGARFEGLEVLTEEVEDDVRDFLGDVNGAGSGRDPFDGLTWCLWW